MFSANILLIMKVIHIEKWGLFAFEAILYGKL